MRRKTTMIVYIVAASLLAYIIPLRPALAWTDRPAATTEDPGHAWTVVFDDPMNTTTMNSQNIYVSIDQNGSSRVEGVAATAADGTHAVVSPPPGGWVIGTTYYLIVTQNVLTGEGMPLEDAVRMQFTVQTPSPVLNDSGIKVFLDDQQLSFDVPPQTIDGRVMVPMRPIFEAMGATLEWDASTQTATAVKDATTVIVRIGNSDAIVNGVVQTLDVPPTAINGSTLAPLRFVAEAFGYHVKWEGASQTAYISAEAFPFEENSVAINGSNNTKVVKSGEWIYYQSSIDNSKLYKVKEDGSGRQKLNDDGTFDINVMGDWIYYRNSSDNSYMYRIKTDGSGREILNHDDTAWSTVSGGWIYYSNWSDNSKLYRIKTDGTERYRMSDNTAEDIHVAGDWVYYTNTFDNGRSLYRIKTDGSSNEILSNDYTRSINVVGDWIYYEKDATAYEGGQLYRIRTDGTGREMINSHKISNINTYGEWIYYKDWDEGDALYRIKGDGSNCQKLGTVKLSAAFFDIADGWVYSAVYDDKWHLYRLKTDGSAYQLFE